jgi:hypothetical protein
MATEPVESFTTHLLSASNAKGNLVGEFTEWNIDRPDGTRALCLCIITFGLLCIPLCRPSGQIRRKPGTVLNEQDATPQQKASLYPWGKYICPSQERSEQRKGNDDENESYESDLMRCPLVSPAFPVIGAIVSLSDRGEENVQPFRTFSVMLQLFQKRMDPPGGGGRMTPSLGKERQ